MVRLIASSNHQSEITPSIVPSKARPTSSPFAFRVAEPELPPVMSTFDRKSMGSVPSAGALYGPKSRSGYAAEGPQALSFDATCLK